MKSRDIESLKDLKIGMRVRNRHTKDTYIIMERCYNCGAASITAVRTRSIIDPRKWEIVEEERE